MKKHLAVLAGLGGTLLAAPGAAAEFTGLSFESKPNEYGIKVCHVYANFDQPGEDHFTAVAGSPQMPAFINVIKGTFFQHQSGTSMPPYPQLFEFAPDLRYDTFVTVGVKSFNPGNPGVPEGQLANNLVLTRFPPFEPGTLELTYGTLGAGSAWAVVPGEPQGDPFNPDFVAGDGRVLIAQLATVDGAGFEGTLNLCFQDCGNDATVSFTFFFNECPWDLDGDGFIGITDFLSGLAQWGTDPGGPPDFDGDGDVGILDFLELLIHWGPCP
jgi:hypothetical protein